MISETGEIAEAGAGGLELASEILADIGFK
jgi:hypothetical protein